MRGATASTVKRLDLVPWLDQQRLARAVDGRARGHLQPVFACAVVLDVEGLLAIPNGA
jgi:hypothetical protein